MVKPQGVRANSWQDVADLSAAFGIPLDGWQELILEAAMGERSDQTWAAKRVGISVPRQNGKSQLLVARALAGALLFGEKKIVVSAHQADTARESYSKLMEIIEADENADLRDRVLPVGKGSIGAFNREMVKFTNGATIQFKARSGPGGKGFSSDCLLLDEAQILGSRAWTSINSTMSAMRNPQVWLLGTPPQEEDDCYTFEMVRQSALDGNSTAAAWCEWGAEIDSDEYRAAQADIAARRWTPAVEYVSWSANPAWNSRINLEVVQGEYETYSAAKFAADRLGQWMAEFIEPTLILPDEWLATGVDEPPSEGVKSFGVKFAPDGSSVAVAGGLKRPDDVIHVELVGARSGSMAAGTTELVKWLAERWRDVAQIVVDGKSHAGVFVDALLNAGVPEFVILTPTWDQVATGNAMLLDAVVTRQMTHLSTPDPQPGEPDQRALDASALGTSKKIHGDKGAWSWAPVNDKSDALPMQAASLAHWAAKTSTLRPLGHRPPSGRSSGGRRSGGRSSSSRSSTR